MVQSVKSADNDIVFPVNTLETPTFRIMQANKQATENKYKGGDEANPWATRCIPED